MDKIPSRKTRKPIRCDKPLEAPPRTLAECPWLGNNHREW